MEVPQEPEGQDEEVPMELVEQPEVSPTALRAIISQMERCANELKAEGEEMFDQSEYRVGPIENFSVAEINSNSVALIQKHATEWPMEKIHQQSHRLVSVTVYEVGYQRKEQDERFWVFGKNKLCYSDDYPAQCCCFCICRVCCNNCDCCNQCTLL